MALAGAGAVAIWNGITPEGRANFYEWHGREHIPERVAIPGFLTGRRYVAEYGDPEYFTLYETTDPAVMSGADYLARLNAPTDWTISSTAHFRDVARALCRVDHYAGSGWGGLIGTWRYERAGDDAEHIVQMRAAVEAIACAAGVAGAQFLVTDRSASAVDTEERRRRGSANQVPGWVLLVEGWGDAASFRALCAEITATYLTPAGISAEHGAYRLQSALTLTDPPGRPR